MNQTRNNKSNSQYSSILSWIAHCPLIQCVLLCLCIIGLVWGLLGWLGCSLLIWDSLSKEFNYGGFVVFCLTGIGMCVALHIYLPFVYYDIAETKIILINRGLKSIEVYVDVWTWGGRVVNIETPQEHTDAQKWYKKSERITSYFRGDVRLHPGDRVVLDFVDSLGFCWLGDKGIKIGHCHGIVCEINNNKNRKVF